MVDMLRVIPKSVKEKYGHLGILDRLYLFLRWMLCPFEIIESYIPQEGVILDIGCGYGLLSNFMAIKSERRRVIGIDSSRKRVDIARASIGKSKNINFYIGDVRDKKIEKCSSVVMSDFLHHISDDVAINLLREINDKLTGEGRLVILDVDKKPFIKYAITYVIDKILNIERKLYYRSSGNLKLLLIRAGFKCETIPVHKGLPLADILFVCTKAALKSENI